MERAVATRPTLASESEAAVPEPSATAGGIDPEAALAWGPLARLAGDWEGEGGLDRAYSHAQHEVLATPYLEKLSFKPFGPVENGDQTLYGLDYKTAMWRGDETNPFHTELGYWLWDAATGEIVRCFVV